MFRIDVTVTIVRIVPLILSIVLLILVLTLIIIILTRLLILLPLNWVILPQQVHAVNREERHVFSHLEGHMAQRILFVMDHCLQLGESPLVIFHC